ncbi:hypothetical protein [Inediibacterium massiliense]|nr:hypothetical protein [Inediibacterium massiliense]
MIFWFQRYARQLECIREIIPKEFDLQLFKEGEGITDIQLEFDNY